jgi:hypothetical protein
LALGEKSGVTIWSSARHRRIFSLFEKNGTSRHRLALLGKNRKAAMPRRTSKMAIRNENFNKAG